MTIIRVNPASVRAYGNTAQEIFNLMRTELQTLINDVTQVHYYGEFAVDFKTKCGLEASNLTNELSKSMGQMAEAVRISTSNIANSLGGAGITIQVNAATVEVPAIASVDFVDVDTAALEALSPVVETRFTTLGDKLKEHLTTLTNTDWEGTAKTNAVTAVTGFTNSATTVLTDAQRQITKYISDQIRSTVAADK